MPQFGGKDSKRHFTVVMGGKEHGLYVSSTPSSAAKKAVTKLCAANKSKKVQFEIREITQGSKKKTYGPYSGYIEKLKDPIELKGRVIKYKPVAKLSGKTGAKKGGMRGGMTSEEFDNKYLIAWYNTLDDVAIQNLIKDYPEYFEQYLGKMRVNSNKKNQYMYLSKFPIRFQRLILEGILKKDFNGKNSHKIDLPTSPIKNKQELLDFIISSNLRGNARLFFIALDIDVNILEKNVQTINNAIINKINEYDP